MPDVSLRTYATVASADPDPIESYPFREYDLSLLRAVMQELITQGRSTDRDYIQGRALLVLVRSLFTKFGWASKAEGSLVTWDVLFDLLVEETTYLPLWVQEMIDNTLVPTFGGDEDAWEVRLAKALYLLNQTPAVPSTPENLARLMLDDVAASLADVLERTESGLETLVDRQKALTETNDRGDEVYTLVSEEQESVLSRAQETAAKISPHQLSAWLGDAASRERRLLPKRRHSPRSRRRRRTSRPAAIRLLDSQSGRPCADVGIRRSTRSRAGRRSRHCRRTDRDVAGGERRSRRW